jgi:hypothetical protein
MKKLTDLPIFRDELTNEKNAEFLGEQIIQMRKILEENPTKDHIPILLIRSIARGTMEIRTDIVAIAHLDDTRFDMMRNLGQQFGERMIPIKAGLFSEAWMTQVKQGEPYVQPSKSADKKEVLIFTAVTLEMKSYGSIYALDRNADGNIVMGDLLTEGEEMQMESNLLKEFFIGAISALKG